MLLLYPFYRWKVKGGAVEMLFKSVISLVPMSSLWGGSGEPWYERVKLGENSRALSYSRALMPPCPVDFLSSLRSVIYLWLSPMGGVGFSDIILFLSSGFLPDALTSRTGLLMTERGRASWPPLAPGSSLRVVLRVQYVSTGVLSPGVVIFKCPVMFLIR